MRHSPCKRIMIVDDEYLIADTLATIIRRAGYDTAAYHDGKCALEACAVRTPDLLLSDVVMPGISGIELAILIKQRYPRCRILLFSGLGASFNLVELANRQGHRFEILEKPLHPDRLLQKIAETLGYGHPLQFPQQPTGT